MLQKTKESLLLLDKMDLVRLINLFTYDRASDITFNGNRRCEHEDLSMEKFQEVIIETELKTTNLDRKIKLLKLVEAFDE